jgi:hypothetical protein
MAHRLPLFSALAVAAVALAAGSAAPARDTEGWDVGPYGKVCTMTSTFEDDVSVGLIWAAPDGEVSFMTGGGDLEKIAGKAGATVSLNASFDGDVPHTDWTDERARVVSVGPHSVAVVADWGPALSKELADTVAGSSMVVVKIGDKQVGSYDLTGSRAAAEELKRCGAKIAAN